MAVDSVHARDLTVGAFMSAYMAPNRPVLIKVCVIERGGERELGADEPGYIS